MGRSQRQKGKRGERETAARFRAVYGDRVCRGWQAREGHDAPDIDHTPFWIENKRCKRVNVRAAVQQALTDRIKANDPRPILVVAHEDQRAPVAVLLLDDFINILQRLQRFENPPPSLSADLDL